MRPTTSCAKLWGNWARMPIMMMSEIPLPKPRSVMRSPSHMTNRVLAVRMITLVINQNLSSSGAASGSMVVKM